MSRPQTAAWHTIACPQCGAAAFRPCIGRAKLTGKTCRSANPHVVRVRLAKSVQGVYNEKRQPGVEPGLACDGGISTVWNAEDRTPSSRAVQHPLLNPPETRQHWPSPECVSRDRGLSVAIGTGAEIRQRAVRSLVACPEQETPARPVSAIRTNPLAKAPESISGLDAFARQSGYRSKQRA